MRVTDSGLTLDVGWVLLFAFFIGQASQSAASDPAKWMLEITRADHAPEYEEVSGDDQEDGVTVMLDDSDGDVSRLHLSGIEFDWKMQGAAVSVRVLLTFDASGSRPNSVRELPVGNYVIHAGESATVSQLARFGLQPVGLKLVTAKPPEAAQPEIVNNTSSIAVGEVDQDRAEYKLLVRNTSELLVHAIAVSVFDGAGRCKVHAQSGIYGGFIDPGGTRELHLSFPVAGEDEDVETPDGESCVEGAPGVDGPRSESGSRAAGTPRIVIEAVDFEDGSYDGNEGKAALLEAERLGHEFERARIVAAVEKKLSSPDPDGMAKLASAQLEVSALSDSADPASVKSIMDRFSPVPASTEASIEYHFQGGLLFEKTMFLNNLKIYRMEASKGAVQSPSFQHWWDATKGRCDLTCPASN
jgi:hypothetical protein